MKSHLHDLEGDVIHGKERTFYSVRIIALCMAVAALVSGVVSVPVVLILQEDASNRAYQADVKACLRNQVARKEANKRLITQRKDAANLGRLTHTMSTIRAAEAQTFRGIGHAFDIDDEIGPLINLLNKASEQDADIAAEQDAVVFKNVVLQNCHDKAVVPKP